MAYPRTIPQATIGRERRIPPAKRFVHKLDQVIRRLPIPTFGRWTQTVAVVWLLLILLVVDFAYGFTLRALINNGVFDPTRPHQGFVQLDLTNLAPEISILPASLTGQHQERVTVLLLGADTRPAEAGYRTPTDTLILLSIDPEQKTAGMLSIPRDLYVDIPGYGFDRINTAYVKGGGQLAIETVEANLGIEVDHYVLVQFHAFVTVVDEIGGIDINVPYNINDPEFPAECYSRDDCGFDPLYIAAGLQHMDGITALKYARTRHGDNDFERARRQQAVLLAVRDRVLRLDMLPRLLQRAPALHEAIGDSLRTDMSLDQLISLAITAEDIPSENIRSAVIDASYVSSVRSPEGASVLVPDEAAVQGLLVEVFSLGE